MKKIISVILILIFFISLTTYVSASPPPQIIIWGEEELLKLREMTEADENELLDYLRHANYFANGMKSREAAVAFLELLDSLLIPYEKGMRFSSFTYYPDSINQTFDISFRSEAGERHSFRLFAGGDRGKSAFEESLNGEQLVEAYRSQNGKLIVYYPPTSWGTFPSERGGYQFPTEINGYFMRSGYSPGDSGITGVTLENIYRNMTVSSFAEAPWSIISISFNTSDALMILRAVAGVTALTDGEMTRFEISGEPATADAMRILRVVAGLA
jgi:hypothetical protein